MIAQQLKLSLYVCLTYLAPMRSSTVRPSQKFGPKLILGRIVGLIFSNHFIPTNIGPEIHTNKYRYAVKNLS